MLARFAIVLALALSPALSSCAPAAGRTAPADGAPTPPVAPALAASPSPPASSLAAEPARPGPERRPRYSFHGNKAVSADDLRAVVLLDKPGLPAGVSNEDVLERDALMITALYYDRGYLLVKVQPPVLGGAALQRDEAGEDPGQPARHGRVSRGRDLHPGDALGVPHHGHHRGHGTLTRVRAPGK